MADLTGGHLVARTLKQAGVGPTFNVVLDPAAYRRTGQVSMAI